MSGTLVILGASSRAAAFSALRAGFTPWCADCFADADLAAHCVTRRAVRWPNDLATIAADFPPGPWLYTGGLENYPALIEQLAASRPLYGNCGAALATARDPLEIQRLLVDAGIDCPKCERSADQLDDQMRWLRKSRRSSGGARVHWWPTGAAGHVDDYFQQFMPGMPCSAAYVAAGGRAVLLGLAEQILWGPRPTARFCYAGSLGPVPRWAALDEQLVRLGHLLASSLGLVGVFGVDGVLADERFWPVEINPRYTASMEIYERATGRSIIAEHAAACSLGVLPGPGDMSAHGWHAKQVLYAERAVCIGPRLELWVAEQNAGSPWPVVADVPAVGTSIAAGQPLLTIFSQGGNRALAAEELERLREQVEAALATAD
ncbi:MAG TPA: ATP-grasp domain-containing protein [Pirellulales bacterium]|jgi:predicted ATP-grasp superfamily ATP-dependent carboligase|nr:ATP-grasp domain-containing protein [Pirellulales bacterium]